MLLYCYMNGRIHRSSNQPRPLAAHLSSKNPNVKNKINRVTLIWASLYLFMGVFKLYHFQV